MPESHIITLLCGPGGVMALCTTSEVSWRFDSLAPPMEIQLMALDIPGKYSTVKPHPQPQHGGGAACMGEGMALWEGPG